MKSQYRRRRGRAVLLTILAICFAVFLLYRFVFIRVMDNHFVEIAEAYTKQMKVSKEGDTKLIKNMLYKPSFDDFF
jgi:mannose/fructose/N-acetylgalactosamine-specific phosphotransferase system component IIC